MDETAQPTTTTSPPAQVPDQPAASSPPLNQEEMNQPTAPATPVQQLTPEETPEIPMKPEAPLPPKKSGSFLRMIGISIACVAFFVIGVWLSSFIRQFIPSNVVNTSKVPEASPSSEIVPSPTASPSAVWNTYEVISGITKEPVPGLSFQLPDNVSAPMCDGTGCISQGTYLPGQTRFTVAARGTGQSLRDYRGTVISDASGAPIPVTQLLVGDYTATVFMSSESGRTTGGYAYTRIRGIMIPITDTLSVEINHFAPSGLTTDFEADDVLFDEIARTITYLVGSPSVTPTATPASTATSSATQ
jgi:hypothetical protein